MQEDLLHAIAQLSDMVTNVTPKLIQKVLEGHLMKWNATDVDIKHLSVKYGVTPNHLRGDANCAPHSVGQSITRVGQSITRVTAPLNLLVIPFLNDLLLLMVIEGHLKIPVNLVNTTSYEILVVELLKRLKWDIHRDVVTTKAEPVMNGHGIDEVCQTQFGTISAMQFWKGLVGFGFKKFIKKTAIFIVNACPNELGLKRKPLRVSEPLFHQLFNDFLRDLELDRMLLSFWLHPSKDKFKPLTGSFPNLALIALECHGKKERKQGRKETGYVT